MLTAPIALAIALLGAAPASGDPFYGANVDAVWTYPAVEQQALLNSLSAAGVRIGRFAVYWDTVEPQPGQFDWSATDQKITELASAGIEPDPILDQSTPWDRVTPASPQTAGPPVAHYAPADPAPFAQFAAAFARRYGVGGSFPTAVADPVHEYEIWNEENFAVYYYPVSPSGYAALYAAARTAVREVDPAATVALGGLGAMWFKNTVNPGTDPYVSRAIAALGDCPDSVGFHAYPLADSALLSALAGYRDAVDAAGCPATPIELSEFDYVGNGDPAANFTQAALSVESAGLGVDRLMPLPAVASQSAIGEPAELPPLENPDGTLTALGHAYASVAAEKPPASLATNPARTPTAGNRGAGSVLHATPAAPLIRALAVKCRAWLTAGWADHGHSGRASGAIDCGRLGRGTEQDRYRGRSVGARIAQWRISGATALRFTAGVLRGRFSLVLTFTRHGVYALGVIRYHGGRGAFRRTTGRAVVTCSGRAGRRRVRCRYASFHLSR